MENNLDDFFRNKLNDDSSADGWDEPNESVWANAQPNFPVHRNSKSVSWLWLSTLLLSLSLIISLCHIYNNKNEKKILSEEIITLQNKLDKQIETTTLLENDFSDFKDQCAIGQKQASLIIENLENTTQKKISTFQDILYQSEKQIQVLSQSNRVLAQKNNDLKNQLTKSKTNQPRPIAVINKNTTTELPEKFVSELAIKPFTVYSENTIKKDLPKIILPKEQWKKYELGISTSSISFNVESTSYFQNAESPEGNVSYFIADATAYGVHFGYAPFENFYIRSGIKYANFYMENTNISGVEYDQSTEYINANGNLVNDLVLNSQTANSETAQTISVEIPHGTTLETGDVLLSTLNNFVIFDYVQFPLGVAFYKGKKRLQWEFQGGLTWNILYFNDYQLEASFRANNVNLPIDDYKLVNTTSSLNQHLAGYLGIGANYKFSDKWQARLGLIVEETGRRTNINNNSSIIQLDGDFNLSLNYRF